MNIDIKYINELKNERAKLVTDIQKINMELRAADADVSKKDELRKLEAAFDAINEQVSAEERNLERMRNLGELRNETPETKQKEDVLVRFEKWFRTGNPEYRDLGEATQYSGLELIPTKLYGDIVRKMANQGVMRKISKVQTVNSNTNVPVSNANATAYWVIEAQAITSSSPTFATVEFAPHKVAAMIKVSTELLADAAFDVPAYLTDEFAQIFGLACEQEYLNGTNSNCPASVIASATLALTSSVTASVALADVMTAFVAPPTDARANGTWLIAEGLLGTFMSLYMGNNTMIYQPSAVAGAPDKFLGRPIYTSPKFATPATTTYSVLFGDFSQYMIMDRTGIAVQRLNELYAATGQVGFKGEFRTDGNLLHSNAIYKIKLL